MVPEGSQRLIDLLVRIPIFERLVPVECKKLLAICKQVTYPEDALIFEVGDPGGKLVIMLRGMVSVQQANGKELARLEAVDTLGEMEIVSAQPRYAQVRVLSDVSGMVITRNDLEDLFEQDPVLGVKILKNVVNSLADKLVAANVKLAGAG